MTQFRRISHEESVFPTWTPRTAAAEFARADWVWSRARSISATRSCGTPVSRRRSRSALPGGRRKRMGRACRSATSGTSTPSLRSDFDQAHPWKRLRSRLPFPRRRSSVSQDDDLADDAPRPGSALREAPASCRYRRLLRIPHADARRQDHAFPQAGERSFRHLLHEALRPVPRA
jgi:hypothetical protein